MPDPAVVYAFSPELNMEQNRSATREIARLSEKVETLSGEVEELQQSVKMLVAAWSTATNLVAFVKWLAGAVAAAGVIYAATKQWFSTR